MASARDPETHPIEITERQAKSARSVGLIWMLIVSVGASAVVVALVWFFYAGKLERADHRDGPGSVTPAQVAGYHAKAIGTPPPAQ